MPLKRIKKLTQSRIESTVSGVIHTCTETYKLSCELQLPQTASSLAYTTILSLVPMLAMSFAIFQAFGGLEKLFSVIEPFILENLAEGVSDEAMNTLKGLIGHAHAGAIGASGLIGLIFTSMSMLSSIEKAIHRIWREPMNRSLFQRIAAYWFFITLGPISAAVLLGAIGGTLGIEGKAPISFVVFHINLLSIIPIILAISFFYGVYKFVPSRPVSKISALVAAIYTSILWQTASWGYNIYTKKVLTAHKLYGSLGAIPILLFWIYIVWLIVLSGAALSACLHRSIEKNAFKIKQETP